MKKFLLALYILLALPLAAAELVSLTPGPGVKLLLDSDERSDYWRLVNYFETQITNTHCGVASGVMVLNALKIEKPYVERFKYPLFTQEEGFFTEDVKQIVQLEQVLKGGMSMSQLARALETFRLSATPLYATEFSLADFRQLLETTLVEENSFLIANWYRPAIGQIGSGHFSPIGAYNKKTDQVLILDVSRYKYPPFWVPAEDLYKSMQPLGSKGQRTRGVILVSNSPNCDTRYT
ncbi:MAG: phytochelatin synthase family protein [Chlamydiales bacterium]|nr:phytochelatin synthase family protein [Chlamydiales bacterium]